MVSAAPALVVGAFASADVAVCFSVAYRPITT